jgi:hypothetical protein
MDQGCWYIPVIPGTQEWEIGRITVPDQPGKKVIETPSQQINQAWWYVSDPQRYGRHR